VVGGKISVTGHTIHHLLKIASPLRYFFEDFFIIKAYASLNALPPPPSTQQECTETKKEWLNSHSQFHIGFSQG
jgi:hypothetical protein